MKYYKNLIKNKQKSVLVLSIIIGILGLLLLITKHPFLIITGLIIAFFCFYYIPKNSYGSRDQEKYYAEEIDGIVRITYDKYEFEFRSGRCNPLSFIYNSKNGYVSFFMWYPIYEDFNRRGYSIINENKRQKEVLDINTISRSEISTFFTVEEIKGNERKVMLSKLRKNKNSIAHELVEFKVVFLRLILALAAYIIFMTLIEMDFSVFIVEFIPIFIIIILIMVIVYFRNSNIKILIKIRNKKIYRLSLLIKEKETYKVNKNGGYEEKYHVRVWNGEYTIAEWIDVSKDIYESATGITVYMSELKGEYYLGCVD